MMERMVRKDRILKRQGAIVDIYDDIMVSPEGHVAHWDYIAHRKGASAVLPVRQDGKILLVRQYRNAIERDTLEIPAGSRDSVEEPHEVCAARELEEETGYRAGKLTPLIKVATTVAFCNEIVWVYLAEDLSRGEQHLDEDEFVEVEAYTLSELTQKIFTGEMQDAKTISAILAYCEKVRGAN